MQKVPVACPIWFRQKSFHSTHSFRVGPCPRLMKLPSYPTATKSPTQPRIRKKWLSLPTSEKAQVKTVSSQWKQMMKIILARNKPMWCLGRELTNLLPIGACPKSKWSTERKRIVRVAAPTGTKLRPSARLKCLTKALIHRLRKCTWSRQLWRRAARTGRAFCATRDFTHRTRPHRSRTK